MCGTTTIEACPGTTRGMIDPCLSGSSWLASGRPSTCVRATLYTPPTEDDLGPPRPAASRSGFSRSLLRSRAGVSGSFHRRCRSVRCARPCAAGPTFESGCRTCTGSPRGRLPGRSPFPWRWRRGRVRCLRAIPSGGSFPETNESGAKQGKAAQPRRLRWSVWARLAEGMVATEAVIVRSGPGLEALEPTEWRRVGLA